MKSAFPEKLVYCWLRCLTKIYWLPHIHFTYMNFLSKRSLSHFSLLQIQSYLLFCGSCIMVHVFKFKGNISLELVKESWLQTSWWRINSNWKPIRLENYYITVGTTKMSNGPVIGFLQQISNKVQVAQKQGRLKGSDSS